MDEARHQLEIARLTERKKFGDSEFMVGSALIIWSAGNVMSDNHPYYWGIVFFAGLALLIIIWPLYWIGERFYWEWTEDLGTWVLGTYFSVVVVSILYQLTIDDYGKILAIVGSIVAIIGGAVGAVIGFKKLTGKSNPDK